MGYEMQLNDPVFFDDTWYVQCNVCEGEYDRNTYNSDTCEGCENKVKVIETQFKGRVLPTSEGEGNE
jgi:hypothetical protein